MTSAMQLRRIACDMQTVARDAPLAEAPGYGRAEEQKFFRQISREVTWGLTLNK